MTWEEENQLTSTNQLNWCQLKQHGNFCGPLWTSHGYQAGHCWMPTGPPKPALFSLNRHVGSGFVSSYIVRSHRLSVRNSLWMFMENNEATGISLIDDWNILKPCFSCETFPSAVLSAIDCSHLIGCFNWSKWSDEIIVPAKYFGAWRIQTHRNLDFLKPLQPSTIKHQPPSTTINPSKSAMAAAKLLRTKKSRAWMMFGCRLRCDRQTGTEKSYTQETAWALVLMFL